MIQEDHEETTRNRSTGTSVAFFSHGKEVVVCVHIIGMDFGEPFETRDPLRCRQEVVHGAAQI